MQVIKKNFLFLLFFTLVNKIDAQSIKGNKVISTTTRLQNSSFSNIDVKSIGNLSIEMGDTSKVIVETDENIQENIITTINNNTLFVYAKGSIQTHKCNIKITCNKLDKLKIQSCGNLTSSNILTFPNLDINAQSIGNILLNLETQQLNLNFKSIGNISLQGKVTNADIKLQSINTLQAFKCPINYLNIFGKSLNTIDINVVKELNIEAYSTASIHLKGKPAIKKMKLQSTANFKQLEK